MFITAFKRSTTDFILNQVNVAHTYPVSLRSISILFVLLLLGLPSCLPLSHFVVVTLNVIALMHATSLQPISFLQLFILITIYDDKIRDASYYAVYSRLLLLFLPFGPSILFTTHFPNILSLCSYFNL